MKFAVNASILYEDMPRYLPDFYPDKYEPSRDGRTDPEVVIYLRNYYGKHLPVDVTAWMRVNEVSESLHYAPTLSSQVCFVRNNLGSIFYPDYDEWLANSTMVIGTHRVNCITLPVYFLTVSKLKLELMMSCNFNYWAVSVKSTAELFFKPRALFSPQYKVPPENCYGFHSDWVYDSYSQNKKEFTLMVNDQFRLYSIMVQILHALDKSD